MDVLFKSALIVVLGAAVIIGIAVGRSQPPFVSSAATVPIATSIPPPPPGVVDIVLNPSGTPPAIYVPATLVVRVGDIVTWTNLSGRVDSATADNGAFNSNALSIGQSFHWTAKAAGTYSYGSFIDPDLRGTLIVQP